MKALKRIGIIALVFALCFVLSMSAFAAVSYKESIYLKATQNNVTSAAYGGHSGKGNVSNHSGSAGDVKLSLQISTGDRWATYQTVTASPGTSNATSVWGEASTNYLFRIFLESSTYWVVGNPGRVAYGSIYTDG